MKFLSEGDRLSNLPETILHHILSFLDMKHVVRTSVLSTRWRYVWTSLPTLNFMYQFKLFDPNETTSVEWFKEFVDQVLNLRDRSSNIQRFNLYSTITHDITCHLRSWILTALSCNVQELYLDIAFDKEFRLPISLFTLKSLTIFEFKSHHYARKLNFPDSMSLPHLKTLLLHNVWLVGNDIPNKIFSSCPVLESFIIRDCDFCQSNLDITALKLKHLVIEECYNSKYKIPCCYGVKLYAPNLISFRCKGYMPTEYSVENLSALVKAEIAVKIEYSKYGDPELTPQMREKYAPWMMKFLRGIQNVKTLTLSDWFLEVVSGAPALLESTHIQLCNLRCLKLRTSLVRDCVHAMTYLLKMSPNIESLSLQIEMESYGSYQMNPCLVEFNSTHIRDYWKEGLPLQCMLFRLKFVEIKGVEGYLDEFMFLEFLLKNAMVLEKLELFTVKGNSPRREKLLSKFSEKVLTLPRASSSIKILFL